MSHSRRVSGPGPQAGPLWMVQCTATLRQDCWPEKPQLCQSCNSHCGFFRARLQRCSARPERRALFVLLRFSTVGRVRPGAPRSARRR